MRKKLSRSGNSLMRVIDKLVVTPIRNHRRTKKLAELVAEAHEQYGGVFKRLAE